jgi:kinesin family protein 4/21/27
MRLQEVLKERESEISVLEESLRAARLPPQVPEDSEWPSTANTPSTNGLVTPPAELATEHLSPKTISKFDMIKDSMTSVHVNGTSDRGQSESDELLDRLNELML